MDVSRKGYLYFSLVVIVAEFVLAPYCNAGLIEWLIPTANAPNDKHAEALSYGLSGGELNSVRNEYVSEQTISKFRQTSQALPYAILSEAAYTGQNSVETSTGKWKRIDDRVGNLGFHASTYRNEQTNQVVIAFQGTCAGGGVKSCLGDIVTDAMGLVAPSPQQSQAVNYTKEIIRKYGDDIDVTGHSLGGGLAQTTAAVFGLDAYTFNSAAVNWTTRGITAAFNQQRIGTPNVTNYVMTGDPVNPLSKVGGIAGRDYGQNVYLDFNVPNVVGEHSLNDVIASLYSMTNYYNDILSSNQQIHLDQQDNSLINVSVPVARTATTGNSEHSSVGSFSSIVTTGQVKQTTGGAQNQQNLTVGSVSSSTLERFDATVTTGSITQLSSGSGIIQNANIGSSKNSQLNSFSATIITGDIEQISNRNSEKQELEIGSANSSTVHGDFNADITIQDGLRQTGSGEILVGAAKNANVNNFSTMLNTQGDISGSNIKLGSIVGRNEEGAD